MSRAPASLLVFGVLLLGIAAAPRQEPPMTFFITSQGSGRGADLGGLEGADRQCHTLAAAARPADSARIEWRAYLSTIEQQGQGAVNARDRIGAGPWYNAKGVRAARNVADLHSDSSTLSKEVSLTEQGAPVNGRGDQPNMHDILTGSNLDGTAYSAEGYTNCGNWTSSGEGSARVGHHDRTGGGQNPTSWNSAHSSRGCSQTALQGSGGNGLFYCFGVVR
jgi:hypothetical protein